MARANKESKLLGYANSSGLLDVVKDWIKNEKYVSLWKLEETFSLREDMAKAVFDFLIEEALLAKEPTYSLGNLVLAAEGDEKETKEK